MTEPTSSLQQYQSIKRVLADTPDMSNTDRILEENDLDGSRQELDALVRAPGAITTIGKALDVITHLDGSIASIETQIEMYDAAGTADPQWVMRAKIALRIRKVQRERVEQRAKVLDTNDPETALKTAKFALITVERAAHLAKLENSTAIANQAAAEAKERYDLIRYFVANAGIVLPEETFAEIMRGAVELRRGSLGALRRPTPAPESKD